MSQSVYDVEQLTRNSADSSIVFEVSLNTKEIIRRSEFFQPYEDQEIIVREKCKGQLVSPEKTK
jgi:hypothetical protein